MFSALRARLMGRTPETHGENYAFIRDDALLSRDDWDEQKGAEITPLFTRCIHGRPFDEWCPPCDDVYPVYRPSA